MAVTPAEGWAVIVPPEELVALLGMSSEDAEQVAQLVQIVVESYCYPATVDPIPPPMHLVGLALASRFQRALGRPGTGAVLSETIGSYSYRLETPPTLEDALAMAAVYGDVLAPWAPWRQGAYTLNTGGPGSFYWPPDWWQRNLDNFQAALDGGAVV